MKKKKMVQIVSFVAICCLSFLTQCVNTTEECSQSIESKLFITESDLKSGVFEWMSMKDRSIQNNGFSIYKDAVVRTYKDNVYILERHGADNIIKFDPSKNGSCGVIYQQRLGTKYNPQDVEFISDSKGYISNQNHPSIVEFIPSSGKFTDTIDISAYTYMKDSNSTPYANSLAFDGSYLYALLQRRNGYNPGAPSLILKIDVSSNTVVDTISLKYKNGFGMIYKSGFLYVSNPGSLYALGDGGIEAVNVNTKAVTEVLSETALGGNPNNIEHRNGTSFYVTCYVGWKNVSVKEVDFSNGTIITTLPNVKDAFGGICYNPKDSILYVGERDSIEMGIRVFKNNIQQGAVIRSSKSLPPTSMAVVNN